MVNVHRRRICGTATGLLLLVALQASAQDKSVKPGINDSFKKGEVGDFVDRFERDGRDAYDHRDEILKACRIKPGMSVADIGAGTGLFTRQFARLVGPEGRVYAVDITEKFVTHIKKIAEDEKLTNVTGVLCTSESTKLPANSIDLAFVCDTYHHFEYPQKTLRSLHSALKPGGQLILIDFRRIKGVSSDWILNHVRADQETFTREIVGAGFRQVDEKDFLKESYFVRFAKIEDAR